MSKRRVEIARTHARLTAYLVARGFLATVAGEKTAGRAELLRAIHANMPAEWQRFFANAHIKRDKDGALTALADHLHLLTTVARKSRAAKVVRAAKVKQSNTEVASDAFLETYEWRRVRMEALKKYGTKCQCCGASPKDGARMNVDHIKPRRIYPQLALDVSNLQVLCNECNHGKGNWDMTDWREAHATETGR